MAFCTHWLCLSQSPLNLSSIGPHSSAYGLFVFRPFFSLDLHFETTPTLMFLHSRRSLITNPTPTPTGPLPFSGASSQRISRSPSLQAPFACSSGPLLDFFSPTLDAGASNTQLLFDYLKKGVVTPVYFVVFRFSLFFFPFPPSSFLFPMQQHMIHGELILNKSISQPYLCTILSRDQFPVFPPDPSHKQILTVRPQQNLLISLPVPLNSFLLSMVSGRKRTRTITRCGLTNVVMATDLQQQPLAVPSPCLYCRSVLCPAHTYTLFFVFNFSTPRHCQIRIRLPLEPPLASCFGLNCICSIPTNIITS
ncbi:hypothetical protein FRC20_003502 [Serendipita sp. 405]|nr:hypothetical protein FRC20_003502 [Serendipita sp. 405]